MEDPRKEAKNEFEQLMDEVAAIDNCDRERIARIVDLIISASVEAARRTQ